ncbi:MAG: hypothetical protein HRU71_05105 [Planctomycetia bacterium]|nr:MAG: hypothetical protein HRU71_05105 [Planctomycetia bacterium]
MPKKWRMTVIVLFALCVGVVINGQIGRHFAKNATVDTDIRRLTRLLADYAKAHDGRLSSSWEELVEMKLLVLGEKAAKSTTRPSTANAIMNPDRCHWKHGALVKEYVGRLSGEPVKSVDSLLVYSDDLNWEDNMVYNRRLLENCGYSLTTGSP